MAINSSADFSLFTQAFKESSYFGYEWIFGLLLTFMILLIVTRTASKWGSLFLPTILILERLGVNMGSFVIWTGLLFTSIIIFVINVFTLEKVSGLIKSGVKMTKRGGDNMGKLLKQARKEAKLDNLRIGDNLRIREGHYGIRTTVRPSEEPYNKSGLTTLFNDPITEDYEKIKAIDNIIKKGKK